MPMKWPEISLRRLVAALWRRPSQPQAVGIARRAGRLDWLVLLPDAAVPNPVVVGLGEFDPDERAQLCDHFGADTIVDSLVEHHAVDVLLVRAAAEIDIPTALSRLAPSGFAYIERVRRRSVGAGRDVLDPLSSTRRAAGEVGATTLASYWMLPGARNPRRFVPLDHVGAYRWYLRNLLIPTGPQQRLARWILDRAPMLARLTANAQATVLVRGPRRTVPLFQSANDAAQEPTRDLRAIVTTSGSDAGSRSVALLFSPGDREPKVVAKVSGRSTINVTTEREYESVRALQAVLPTELLGTMPRVFDLIRWNSRAVIVEEAFSGHTVEAAMGQSPDPKRRIFELERAATWLTDLGHATAEPTVWSEEHCDRWVRAPLDDYVDRFAPPADTVALFERTRALADDLIGQTVPIVRRHFDPGPWNMIASPQGLRVIDWEITAERPIDRRGLPLVDLSYYVKYWLHTAADARLIPDVSSLFDFVGPTDLVEPEFLAAGRAAIAQYCDRLAIDAGFVPVLTVHTWVEKALHQALKIDLHGRARDEPILALGFVSGLSDQADQLFEGTGH